MTTLKTLCGICKRDTNHSVLAEHKAHDSDDDNGIQWWGTFQVIQCKGCDNISFRSISRCTEDWDPRTGDLLETINIYPKITSGREPLDDCDEFPSKTEKIYLETLDALNNKTPMLAAMGLRTLIESICLEQKTKSKNLSGGIDELAAMGLLSRNQAEFLHNLRFMGNTAAHEIVAPRPHHLVTAFDIAETLLKTIYILPNLANQLKKTAKKI